MVLAIASAIVGVVSATASIVKATTTKRAGVRATNEAIVQADRDKINALRQGSRDRLVASRLALIQAQAEQSKLLLESRKNANRVVILMAGSSLLLLTIAGLRRKK